MSDDDPWLRFADLKRMQIVSNHITLKRWIDQEGFPPGNPNTRAWRRSWIQEWLANRPTENTRQRGTAKRKRRGRKS